MNLFDAEILAKTAISEWLPEYQFRWNNLKRINGRCVYATKTIEMSRHLTPLRTNQAVLQTIMHEIAHGLHPSKGHGPEWKAQMRAFGLPANRCAKDVVDRSSISNWLAVCSGCKTKNYFIRKPRVTYICKSCYKQGEKITLTFQPI